VWLWDGNKRRDGKWRGPGSVEPGAWRGRCVRGCVVGSWLLGGEDGHGVVEGEVFDGDEEVDSVSLFVSGGPDPVGVFDDEIVKILDEEVVAVEFEQVVPPFEKKGSEMGSSGIADLVFGPEVSLIFVLVVELFIIQGRHGGSSSGVE